MKTSTYSVYHKQANRAVAGPYYTHEKATEMLPSVDEVFSFIGGVTALEVRRNICPLFKDDLYKKHSRHYVALLQRLVGTKLYNTNYSGWEYGVYDKESNIALGIDIEVRYVNGKDRFIVTAGHRGSERVYTGNSFREVIRLLSERVPAQIA